MDLDVPPGSVRLLSFRPYENRPILLAIDSHFSQGATDFKTMDWNPNTRILSGQFQGIENTGYKLWILVPDGFVPNETSVSADEVEVASDDDTMRLKFHCTRTELVDFHIKF
jgi:hypothetical protein